MSFTIANDRIVEIDILSAPDRLAQLAHLGLTGHLGHLGQLGLEY